MPYRVFLSHSARDQGLVIGLARLLEKYGIDVSVAEWSIAPGQPLATKILRLIDRADSVIVLLTRDGVRSNWVHQEIGYARKAGKPVIPLVETGVPPHDLGSLSGMEYVEYDPQLPWEALNRLSAYVRGLRLREEERDKGALVAGGLLAFLLLFSAGRR